MDRNKEPELSPTAVGREAVSPTLVDTAEEISRIDSVYEFKQRGAQNLVIQMKEELDKLEKSGNISKENRSKFLALFSQYLRTRTDRLEWDRISPPPQSFIVDYAAAEMPSPEAAPEILNKLAVLKLNGGLGTSMGCKGPKSAIHVKDGLNFIDLSVRQVEHLNSRYGTNVPLLLMNSFSTQKQTESLINRYKNVRTFNQSVFPRIFADTLLPVSGDAGEHEKEAWYPPGHGDLFASLQDTGMLDRLLEEGKEYLFVSNVDNLKAIVDLAILSYVSKNGIDFLMEVTKKTRADVKGGTLIEYDGALRLLEIAQVGDYHKNEFMSIRKFKIFNTNSVWISLHAIKKALASGSMALDVIENKKKLSTGEEVIQLETALGAAIRYFEHAKGMVVPRGRFLPVKTCSDLFLLQSTLFSIRHGTLKITGERTSDAVPVVRLVGSHYKKVDAFRKRIKGPINVDDLEHLTISGEVSLGKNVTLKGTVIIIAVDGQSIDIPDGTILDDKIVTGCLAIVNH